MIVTTEALDGVQEENDRLRKENWELKVALMQTKRLLKRTTTESDAIKMYVKLLEGKIKEGNDK